MMLGYDGLQAKGIDRHVLGLYLMSRDMGIDTPAIFSDPLFTKRSVELDQEFHLKKIIII